MIGAAAAHSVNWRTGSRRSSRVRRRGASAWAAFLLLAWLRPAAGLAKDSPAALDAWLASQTNLVTWQAAVTQTRVLSTMTEPLTTRGKVWFAAPNRFRWEIGDPPQTIAVRQDADVLIVYPRLKRAEKYALDAAATGPWRDAVALIDAGFPRSRSELDAAFAIGALTETNGIHTVALRPKSAAARKILPEVRLSFSAIDHGLRSTQLRFADGSLMRNDFSQVVTNASIADVLFQPQLTPEYQISQPGAKGSRR